MYGLQLEAYNDCNSKMPNAKHCETCGYGLSNCEEVVTVTLCSHRHVLLCAIGITKITSRTTTFVAPCDALCPGARSLIFDYP